RDFSCSQLPGLNVVGHALDCGDGVDIADPDTLADAEDDGGIVEDGAHAARDEQVGRLLRALGGDGDDADADLLLTNGAGDLRRVLNDQVIHADGRADLGRVAVEDGGD